jgi:hypothetical protein
MGSKYMRSPAVEFEAASAVVEMRHDMVEKGIKRETKLEARR